MIAESLFSGFGCDVTRIRFFANELLFDGDVIFRFECLGVAREIAIGHAEQFLERIEIGRIVDHEHAHNAEPYAVVKSLIDILYDVFQCSKFSCFDRI